MEQQITESRVPINLVYAGRRLNKFVYFEINDDKTLGNRRVFSRNIFTNKTIGATYNVEADNDHVFFDKNQAAQFLDFENRLQLVEEWKCEDSLVDKAVRATKEIKDVHRFNSLRAFKRWYKSKSPIEQQYVLTDLITFLNNNV